MGWESFHVVTFDHGPFLGGQTGIAKSKVLINCFFLVLEVCNVKASCRKSCARNLFDVMWSYRFGMANQLTGNHGLGIFFMWSDLTLDPSFKVKQGYPNLKALLSHLLLVLEL